MSSRTSFQAQTPASTTAQLPGVGTNAPVASLALQHQLQVAQHQQLIPPLSVLADPPIRQIDGAAMDFFLIELVNTLKASSAVASNRARMIEKEMIENGLLPLVTPAPTPTMPSSSSGGSTHTPNQSAAGQTPPVPGKKDGISARDSVTSLTSKAGGATGTGKGGWDEDEESVRIRLEAIGVHIGSNFTERLCKDKPLFPETLDAIKFICKELWVACWDKQVDNLRTNHRGVYVLQDNSFKPIARLSSWEGKADATRRARLYTAMPAGIIRGSLARLGINATVVPEVTTLPQCTFQVKLPKGT
ncbi:hypothetical protein AX16_003944 [Volvariella volvacea WC 439]|nr:hypothetical protein AX16_003944 [Volvariella volvacea WC 439]